MDQLTKAWSKGAGARLLEYLYKHVTQWHWAVASFLSLVMTIHNYPYNDDLSCTTLRSSLVTTVEWCVLTHPDVTPGAGWGGVWAGLHGWFPWRPRSMHQLAAAQTFPLWASKRSRIKLLFNLGKNGKLEHRGADLPCMAPWVRIQTYLKNTEWATWAKVWTTHFIYRRPTLYPLEIAVDFLKSL